MTRKILRRLLKVVIALQAIPFVWFLLEGNITNALYSLVLPIYMFLVLHFEGRSYELNQEKKRLEDFLNSIPMGKDKIKEALENYGRAIVSEVVELVQMSDPDGCYSMYQDMGMFDHAECVEFLYFEA